MKYSYESIDERIIKTKLALSGAILDIMVSKPKVKVLDICQRADISAMTYYHHFHNKYQLLEFSVRNQLENILPIPLKLKPDNMRQLIAYLIKSFSGFIKDNKELIVASVNKMMTIGYKNSYIQILIDVVRYWIFHEISKIIGDKNRDVINIWTDVITYGLLLSLIRRSISLKSNEFYLIWNSLRGLQNAL